MWWLGEDGLLAPVVPAVGPEPYNLPRQALAPVYMQNGCIDVVWARVILEDRSMTGKRIRGMVMEDDLDIDSAADFQRALETAGESHRGLRSSPYHGARMTFCVDIDGVVAALTPGLDYSKAGPRSEVVRAVNALHDAGHRIVLFTARGSATGRDWRETTERQLDEWGVRYDTLRFGKPAADWYVDDRSLSIMEFVALGRGSPEDGGGEA
jgi:hypothetical protein